MDNRNVALLGVLRGRMAIIYRVLKKENREIKIRWNTTTPKL